MLANTGTLADSDAEAANEGTKSKNAKSAESPEVESDKKRSYITRTVIAGESFEAGSYGTYASIFMLLIGKFNEIQCDRNFNLLSFVQKEDIVTHINSVRSS